MIFCAFLREQKMAVARASVADIRSESLAVRAAWQPGHLRWLLTRQCREPTSRRARVALFHLSTATGSTFVFRLRGPSKVISPSSRFKISSDSYYLSILYSGVWFCVPSDACVPSNACVPSACLPCFDDLVTESMGDWEKDSALWS